MKALGKLFGSATKSKSSSESSLNTKKGDKVSRQKPKSIVESYDEKLTEVQVDALYERRVSADNLMVAEIEENERWDHQKGVWSHLNLKNSDPKRFKSSAGQSETFPNPPLSRGWIYDGKW